jgi:hypothetical protein
MLKNGVSVRDPVLRGSGGCSHTGSYAALPPSPRALADGPMVVFQQSVNIENGKAMAGVCGRRRWTLQNPRPRKAENKILQIT